MRPIRRYTRGPMNAVMRVLAAAMLVLLHALLTHGRASTHGMCDEAVGACVQATAAGGAADLDAWRGDTTAVEGERFGSGGRLHGGCPDDCACRGRSEACVTIPVVACVRPTTGGADQSVPVPFADGGIVEPRARVVRSLCPGVRCKTIVVAADRTARLLI